LKKAGWRTPYQFNDKMWVYPYRYQLDAIEQALAVLEKYNGAILADVVGLGKTVIACAVARQLKKRGVIVCPPGLMGSEKTKDAGWYMYKEQFGLYDWEVWSLGDLEDLQQFVNKAQDIEVVIVDEAHRFRNQNTRGYELYEIFAGTNRSSYLPQHHLTIGLRMFFHY